MLHEVNVVDELKLKRTAAASRGFLAAQQHGFRVDQQLSSFLIANLTQLDC